MTPTNLRGDFYGVEVPEGHTWDIVTVDGRSYLAGDDDHGMMQLLKTPLPPGTWQIICLSGECTEEQAAEVVGGKHGDSYLDWDAGNPFNARPCALAENSLSSLLRPKGLPEKNTLILKQVR